MVGSNGTAITQGETWLIDTVAPVPPVLVSAIPKKGGTFS